MPRSYPTIALVYLVGYVALDWLSYIAPYGSFGITPWNPQTGLTIALVVLFGVRFLPLVVLAPLLADALVRGFALPWWLELATAGLIACGYGAACVALIDPRLRFNPTLTTRRDLGLLLAAACCGGLVVAFGYVTLLTVSGVLDADSFVPATFRFWVGDVIGITVVTPFVLLLMTRQRLLKPTAEMLAPLALLFGALVLVFGFEGTQRLQMFYLLFPPVIWAAFRFSLQGVAWALVLTQIGLLLAIQLSGHRTFDLTTYQMLMIVLAMTGLGVGMLVSEQTRTEQLLRMQQDALARASRLGSMGEFAAALAHEINQPLAALGNYTRAVRRAAKADPIDVAGIDEASSKAVEQVERAADVVRRLRDFISQGRTETTPQPAASFVEEAVALYQAEFDDRGVRLDTRIAPALREISVDKLQMEQVVANLLRNSLEALTEAGRIDGKVTVSVEPIADRSVCIVVRDNGPGFDPSIREAHPRAFATTKPNGMGLGLSLSQSIVEAHGGRMSIGGGSGGAIITIVLPVTGETTEAKEAST